MSHTQLCWLPFLEKLACGEWTLCAHTGYGNPHKKRFGIFRATNTIDNLQKEM